MRISDWSSDVCSSDLRTRPCQGIGQLRPEPPPRPAVEAVVDRRRWSIVCRTVAPPAAGFQYMKDARNHPPVIDPSRTRLVPGQVRLDRQPSFRSEEHTSELQSLMRISYAVFCLKKKTRKQITNTKTQE